MDPKRFYVQSIPDAFDGFVVSSDGQTYISENGLVQAKVSLEWAAILGPWCKKEVFLVPDANYTAALDSNLAFDDPLAPHWQGDVTVDGTAICVDYDIHGGFDGNCDIGPDDVFSWTEGQGVFLLCWARAITRTVRINEAEQDDPNDAVRIENTFEVMALPMPYDMRFVMGMPSQKLKPFGVFYFLTNMVMPESQMDMAMNAHYYDTYDDVNVLLRQLDIVKRFEVNMIEYPSMVSIFMTQLRQMWIACRPGYTNDQQLPDFVMHIPVLTRGQLALHYLTKASLYLNKFSNACFKFGGFDVPESTGAGWLTNMTTFARKPKGWIGYPIRFIYEFAGNAAAQWARYTSYLLHVPYKSYKVGPKFIKKDFLSAFKGGQDLLISVWREFSSPFVNPFGDDRMNSLSQFGGDIFNVVKTYAWFPATLVVSWYGALTMGMLWKAV